LQSEAEQANSLGFLKVRPAHDTRSPVCRQSRPPPPDGAPMPDETLAPPAPATAPEAIALRALHAAPRPVAPFSRAEEADGQAFVTGQRHVAPDRLPARACVGVTGRARNARAGIDPVAHRP